MPILFAGGEDIEFLRLNTPSYDSSSAWRRRDTWSRVGLGATSNHSWRGFFPQANDFFFKCQFLWGSLPGVQSPVAFGVGSNAGIRFKSANPTSISFNPAFEIWNGSAWIQVTSSSELWQPSTSTPQPFMMYLKIAEEGVLMARHGQFADLTYYGDTRSFFNFSNLSMFELRGTATSAANVFSEIIISTEDPWYMSLKTLVPAAGTNSEWTGPVGNINTIVESQATLVTSDTPGQMQTYNVTDLNAGSEVVKAVVISANARRGTGGPQGMSFGVRTNNVNHWRNRIELNSLFTNYREIMDLNPVTGQPWTRAEVNALEIGMRSES